MDFLIVGLGNPGKEYDNTRHNIGFNVIDALAEKSNLQNFQDRFKGQIGQVQILSKKVFLLKPQTYMNLSGSSVSQCVTFYKIPINNIIVIHDDLDLNLSRLKFKIGGGNGGHNGLKSLDSMIGVNYARLRFGISHPGKQNNISNFVLSKFRKDEEDTVNAAINYIVSNIGLLIKEDSVTFLNNYAKIYQSMICVEISS